MGDDEVEVICVIVTGVCVVGKPVMSSNIYIITSSTKCYGMHYGYNYIIRMYLWCIFYVSYVHTYVQWKLLYQFFIV